MVAVEDEAVVPVVADEDPADGVPESEGTVFATVALPVLDAVLPDAAEDDDVTPPVERSCPRIARRDCSSASSAAVLPLEAPDPVAEDVDEPDGSVVAICVKPTEGPPVAEVVDPAGGADGVPPSGGVVSICVKLTEGPPVADVDDPVEGAGGVPSMGGVGEGPPVEPLVPVPVATTPGAPFI